MICSTVELTQQMPKIFRSPNSMTQSNTVPCIIELSYLQYSMSMDFREPLLTIEKSTSYMDVQKPFSTWWPRRSMASIPTRSQFFLFWDIMNISLNSIPGRRSECSLLSLSFVMLSPIWKLLETMVTAR